jgi:RNase P subunit RPR2
MKLVRRGVIPEEKIYRTTCNNCKSVYEYKAGEVKRVNDQRDGDYLTFPCEVCGCEVTQSVNVTCSTFS